MSNQIQTEFELGSYIDLRYINQKSEAASGHKKSKKPFHYKGTFDTQIVFERFGQEFKAWRRIPIVYAT